MFYQVRGSRNPQAVPQSTAGHRDLDLVCNPRQIVRICTCCAPRAYPRPAPIATSAHPNCCTVHNVPTPVHTGCGHHSCTVEPKVACHLTCAARDTPRLLQAHFAAGRPGTAAGVEPHLAALQPGEAHGGSHCGLLWCNVKGLGLSLSTWQMHGATPARAHQSPTIHGRPTGQCQHGHLWAKSRAMAPSTCVHRCQCATSTCWACGMFVGKPGSAGGPTFLWT